MHTFVRHSMADVHEEIIKSLCSKRKYKVNNQQKMEKGTSAK